MEPGGSLPHSQQPATCPYPEPAQSSTCPQPTSWRSIIILSYHLRVGLSSGRLPSGLPAKILYAPPFSPVLHAPPIFLLDLITRIIIDGLLDTSNTWSTLINTPWRWQLICRNIRGSWKYILCPLIIVCGCCFWFRLTTQCSVRTT
jgi:hypothetical protein